MCNEEGGDGNCVYNDKGGYRYFSLRGSPMNLIFFWGGREGGGCNKRYKKMGGASGRSEDLNTAERI